MESISEALGIMRNGKAGGPSGTVREHFTASQNGKQATLETAVVKGKGLKLNIDRSNILECSTGKNLSVESKIDTCCVYGRRAKSIRCKTCQKWVHAHCAKVKKVTGRMNGSFESTVCIKRADENTEHNIAKVGILGELDGVKNICYLGDSIDGGGGSDLAPTRRVALGLKVFNTLSSILCGKRYMSNLKRHMNKLCLRPVMTYGLETWVERATEEDILRRVKRHMVQKMCGSKLADRLNRRELMQRLVIKGTPAKNVWQRILS